MEQRIVHKPAFDAIGYALHTTTAGGENMRAIPQFWDRLHADGKAEGLGRIAGRFGVLGLCAGFDSKMEKFTYVIGVEMQPGVPLPEGSERVHVPAATYAVFACVGAMPDAIQAGWQSIMGEWLPSSAYVQASPVNFELYPTFPEGDERGDPASPRCYTEIWIPIKQK